jgi:cytochrome d ubiquinol oxidase subunit II
VAQSPEVLPGALTFAEAAAPPATLWSLIAVTVAAVVLVVPALALLFALQQRGALGDAD